MATEKRVNYTPEQTAELIERYNAGAGESIESLAEWLNKPKRSVIGKLVREGVYVAPEAPAKAKREEGPTKKELLNTLESLVPFPVEGLMGATKEAISFLIAAFTSEDAEDEAEASEADAA